MGAKSLGERKAKLYNINIGRVIGIGGNMHGYTYISQIEIYNARYIISGEKVVGFHGFVYYFN